MRRLLVFCSLLLCVAALTSLAAAQEPARLMFHWQSDDTQCGRFGQVLDGAGDVDSDGVPDLIVGSAIGCVRVLSGRTGVALYTFTDYGSSKEFGSAVAGGGDANGDGVPDLLIGANGASPNGEDSGKVWLRSGADGAVIRTHQGDGIDDHFGKSLTFLGDVDGDGLDDYAVGATAPIYPIEPTDYVRVFSGASGAVLYTLEGSSQEGDRFGYQLDRVDDLNGDGAPELLVGVPMDSTNPNAGFWLGSARVYSGADGRLLRRHYGDQTYGFLGSALAAADDVDGDGVSDYMAGAWGDDTAGVGAGMVRVWSGASGAVLHTFYGAPSGEGIGVSMGPAGDQNGDGFGDLAIGAPYAFQGGVQVGRLRIDSGADGTRLADWWGTAVRGDFGTAAENLGDLDGDGIAELVVSSQNETGATSATGAVRLFAGALRSLWSETHQLSSGAGGAQALHLNAGAAFAGMPYRLLGSATGTTPGIDRDGHHLALTPDFYFDRTRLRPNAPPLVDSAGVLDAAGAAEARFELPPGAAAAYVGTTVWHAYVVYEPNTLTLQHVSAPVPVTLLD
ncbi:MAG TPA: integrin alpha [Planctomycetota bacterium]